MSGVEMKEAGPGQEISEVTTPPEAPAKRNYKGFEETKPEVTRAYFLSSTCVSNSCSSLLFLPFHQQMPLSEWTR